MKILVRLRIKDFPVDDNGVIVTAEVSTTEHVSRDELLSLVKKELVARYLDLEYVDLTVAKEKELVH